MHDLASKCIAGLHMIWDMARHVLYHKCTAADSTYHTKAYTTSYPWALSIFLFVDSNPCHHCTCCFRQHSAVDFFEPMQECKLFAKQLNWIFCLFSGVKKTTKDLLVSCRVHVSSFFHIAGCPRAKIHCFAAWPGWHYGSDTLCSPSPTGHKSTDQRWNDDAIWWNDDANFYKTLTQHSTSHEIIWNHEISSLGFYLQLWNTTWSKFSNQCVCCRPFLFEKSTQSTLMEP